MNREGCKVQEGVQEGAVATGKQTLVPPSPKSRLVHPGTA